MTNLLNPDGTVAGEGWLINAPSVSSNQVLARSHWNSQLLSSFMARNLNFLMIRANNYQINLVVPMQLGGICTSKITWFDIEVGPQSEVAIESLVCPVMQ